VPTAAVPFIFSQVIFGINIASWTANNGNVVYANAVVALLRANSIFIQSQSVTVVAVGLSASASRLGLGSSRALQTQGSIQVTTTVQIPPGTAPQVQTAVTGSTSGVQNTISTMRTTEVPGQGPVSSVWQTVTAQPAVAAGSPVLPPTPAPSATSNNANSQAAAATSVQGLPQTTIIAIVVVLVVVVGAVLFVCYQQNMKKDLSPALALAEHYRRSNSEHFAGRRPSSLASRGSRRSIEMTDTYGINADYDDHSLASDRRSGDNPAFGMSARNSLNNGRNSINGRASIDGGRRSSSGARPSFDQMTPRTPGQVWAPSGNVPAPPGTPAGVTRLSISSPRTQQMRL
jgi:hypothetical protein